ncbi:MAG: LamG domain-containing protein [Candidatus Brocadiales bacterium]|nr:LamG domain-containing protein [Candidatus Brocadiales bacterium]
MVVGGDCSSDSFAKEAGWAYDAGNDEYDGTNVVSNNSITQSIGAITRYRSYATQFEIKNYSSGEMKALVGAYEAGAPYSEDGKHSDIITPVNGSSNTTLYIGGVSSFNGSVDNISLKPLLSADITPQGNHAEVWGADVQAEYTEFDGTSHYFNSNINPNSLFGDGGIFSISCWCYNEGTASVNEYIAGAMDSSSNRFYFRNQDGYYRWGYGATATTNTAAAVVNSQWQFVTFAYDGAIMRTYLDGILVNSFSITVQTITSKDLHIGVLNNNGFPENYFDGRLDSFRFYSRALSATEVLALYNKGRN